MFLVIIPVIVPYFLDLGLSMREVFELQAIFGFVVAIFEVPSGYICDLWGRKKTLLLGAFVSGLGFTSLIFAKDYFSLAMYEIIIAISLSLVSGADISILYDSLSESNSEGLSTSQAMANIQFSKVLAESVASILGGLLVALSFDNVVLAQAIAGWAPFLVALSIKEPVRNTLEVKSHLDNFKKVFRFIFFEEKILRLVFINYVVWGLSTFFAVWIFQKYWLEEGISLLMFGFIWAGYNITVGIVGKQVPRLEKKAGAVLLLIAIPLLSIGGYFSLAFFSGWVGIGLGLLFQVGRGINSVLIQDALNWRTPSEFRATVNSLGSLFFRAGFFLLGPIVGISIDENGLSFTMIVLGSTFIILFILTMIPLVLEVKKLGLGIRDV